MYSKQRYTVNNYPHKRFLSICVYKLKNRINHITNFDANLSCPKQATGSSNILQILCFGINMRTKSN